MPAAAIGSRNSMAGGAWTPARSVTSAIFVLPSKNFLEGLDAVPLVGDDELTNDLGELDDVVYQPVSYRR
ncbi:hypothetical protein CBI38_31415 (plasmid) [Rhodococcus oxybenzonivorans]|uniref:Uncharacterized protein n=1 Tax=Rhodococcus oxybenzonivorans TaxID=1990687 RepID=A0A2S2C595_9NOCA|nr:hypothetical protein CBI38_31415 [Rhodococcus oxybenzonivorans]